jgi:hypothetical protein
VGYVATNNQDDTLPITLFRNRVKLDMQKQARSKFEEAARKRQEREEALRQLMENIETKGCWVIAEVFSAEGDYMGYTEAYVECPKGTTLR